MYLLTDLEPATLPAPLSPGLATRLPQGVRPGLVLERSEPASPTLLTDLRNDKGMDWLPSSGMWLSYLRVDAKAGDLDYDLAIDASGAGQPSPVAAGLGLEAAADPAGYVLVRTGDLDRDRRARAAGRSGRSRASPDRTPGGLRPAMRRGLLAVVLVALGACAPASASPSVRGPSRSGSTTRRSRSTRSTSSRARPCGSSSRTRTRSITSSSSGTGPCRSRTSSGPRRSTRRGRGDHDPGGRDGQHDVHVRRARPAVRVPSAGSLRVRHAGHDRGRSERCLGLAAPRAVGIIVVRGGAVR